MASLSAKLKSSLGGFYDTLSSPLSPPMVADVATPSTDPFDHYTDDDHYTDTDHYED